MCRIALNQALATSFTDTGFPSQVWAPPDPAFLERLRATGHAVSDPRTGITYPALDVDAALRSFGYGSPRSPDGAVADGDDRRAQPASLSVHTGYRSGWEARRLRRGCSATPTAQAALLG